MRFILYQRGGDIGEGPTIGLQREDNSGGSDYINPIYNKSTGGVEMNGDIF